MRKTVGNFEVRTNTRNALHEFQQVDLYIKDGEGKEIKFLYPRGKSRHLTIKGFSVIWRICSTYWIR